jgi:hypothetical protein
MAAKKLLDFSDIYTAMLEELKIQAEDTTTLNRLKRLINIAYLDEIVPFKNWWWLNDLTKLSTEVIYETGTVAVTNGSTTATLSTTLTPSRAGYYFNVVGTEEVYKISAHTAATAILTLDVAYAEDTNATASFMIWTDAYALPVSWSEATQITHAHSDKPLTALGENEFDALVVADPLREGRPLYFTVTDFYDPTPNTEETETDRYRRVRVYPSLSEDVTVLSVSGTKEAIALDLDGDEPLMPISDRSIILYKALADAWPSIGRNPEEGARNDGRYMRKLERMAGKRSNNQSRPQLSMSRRYLSEKRRTRSGNDGW